MAIEKPAPWTGASGTEYAFYVFGLEPDVPKRRGLYIYAKRNAEGAWVPIFMGQGDVSRGCEDQARHRCIASKAATHIHLRLKSDEADRESELADLLAQYANVFAPEGCQPPAGSPATRYAKPPGPARKPIKKAVTKKAAAKTPATKKAATKKAPAKKTLKARKSPLKAKPKSPRPRSK